MYKILFFSPVSYFKGGAERSLFDLLANPDIIISVVAPDNGPIIEEAQKLGYQTFIIPFGTIETVHRPFSFVKALRAIADLLKASHALKTITKNHKIDYVHSNGLKAHVINCLAYRLGGSKAIIHIRDIPYTSSENIVWKILRVLCYRMVLVSAACWPENTLPTKVSVIYNGTPVIAESHNEHRFHTPIRLGFIGRIHPAKGLHLLLEWMSDAKKNGIDSQLIVKGSFSQDAPDYEGKIMQMIQALGLENAVKFKGFVNQRDQLYHDLDVVVVPSHVPDPLPRSVMEAMAHGVPVLGYPAGGIGEMIIHKQTGFLVKDSQDFTQAIRSLISDPDRQQQIILQAKIRIQKEFSIERLHEKMNQLYQNG